MTGEKHKLVIVGSTKHFITDKSVRSKTSLYDYYQQNHSWMNRQSFEDILTAWNNEAKSDHRHLLLFVDGCEIHKRLKRYSNIHIEYLPPNMTSLLQLADQCWIRSFKAHYRSRLLQYQYPNPDTKDAKLLTKARRSGMPSQSNANIKRPLSTAIDSR